MTILSIKSVWKWKSISFFKCWHENLLPILMRLTRVVLTYWISSITSKISWIVSWPWSNHVCVWVCVCVCLWLILQIDTWAARTNIDIFVWKFWFWPGEVMEKSWDFILRFCGNPVSCILSRVASGAYLAYSLIEAETNCYHFTDIFKLTF